MLAQGMKIHLILRESPNQAKKKDIHLRGKIEEVHDKYIVIQTTNYKTCINFCDFNSGHAVLI